MNVLSVAGDDGMDGMEWGGLRAGNGIPTFFFPFFLDSFPLFYSSLFLLLFYLQHALYTPTSSRSGRQSVVSLQASLDTYIGGLDKRPSLTHRDNHTPVILADITYYLLLTIQVLTTTSSK